MNEANQNRIDKYLKLFNREKIIISLIKKITLLFLMLGLM